MDGGPGVGDVGLGLLVERDRFLLLGVGEAPAEAERSAAPVADGIAMHGGSVGGGLYGCAIGDGGDHLLLNGSEATVVGSKHFASF